MSIFKNTVTGNVTTVFGEVHDNFALRSDEELVFDDRNGHRDFATEGLDKAPDEAAGAEADPKQAKKAELSQTTTPDAESVDNPKE